MALSHTNKCVIATYRQSVGCYCKALWAVDLGGNSMENYKQTKHSRDKGPMMRGNTDILKRKGKRKRERSHSGQS